MGSLRHAAQPAAAPRCRRRRRRRGWGCEPRCRRRRPAARVRHHLCGAWRLRPQPAAWQKRGDADGGDFACPCSLSIGAPSLARVCMNMAAVCHRNVRLTWAGSTLQRMKSAISSVRSGLLCLQQPEWRQLSSLMQAPQMLSPQMKTAPAPGQPFSCPVYVNAVAEESEPVPCLSACLCQLFRGSHSCDLPQQPQSRQCQASCSRDLSFATCSCSRNNGPGLRLRSCSGSALPEPGQAPFGDGQGLQMAELGLGG